MLEQDQPGIFSRDDRIEPAQIGENAADVAEQKPERVDEMDRRLVNEKALHGLEIGLPVEIGARALPVSRPQPERCLVDIAQRAAVEPALDLAIPGLETEIVVHDKLDAGALGFRPPPFAPPPSDRQNGFWQMTLIPRAAASRISARCDGGGLTMSTRSGRSASSIAAASV